MDDLINQVQHEETCSTCTSEKAITAEIILIHTQMSSHPGSTFRSSSILSATVPGPILDRVKLHCTYVCLGHDQQA